MRTARCLLVLGPALASVNYPQQNYGWGPPPPGGEPQQPVARAAPPGHPQQQGAAPGQPPPAMPEGALVPSGVPWHVLEMRRRFPGVDDATLQRFLVARQWKIDKAALMIEKHILWRSSFPLPVDPLLCADELTSGRTFVRGFDRWGHPIIWHFPRAGQPSQDARAGLKAAVFWAEAVAQQQGGNADGKVALVVCRAGERAPAFNLGAMSELLSTLSHNFPEKLAVCLVWPAPAALKAAWRLVSPVLDSTTRSKVQLLQDASELQHWIDPGSILQYLGGSDNWRFTPLAVPGLGARCAQAGPGWDQWFRGICRSYGVSP